MNNHNEVIETLGLIKEIKEIGINKLDQGDYKIIENFIDQLTPYNNMVKSTVNSLEIKLEDTYTREDKNQFDFFNAKAIMIDELVGILKEYLKQINL